MESKEADDIFPHRATAMRTLKQIKSSFLHSCQCPIKRNCNWQRNLLITGDRKPCFLLFIFLFVSLQAHVECNLGTQRLLLQQQRLPSESRHDNYHSGPRETMGQGKKKLKLFLCYYCERAATGELFCWSYVSFTDIFLRMIKAEWFHTWLVSL